MFTLDYLVEVCKILIIKILIYCIFYLMCRGKIVLFFKHLWFP